MSRLRRRLGWGLGDGGGGRRAGAAAKRRVCGGAAPRVLVEAGAAVVEPQAL